MDSQTSEGVIFLVTFPLVIALVSITVSRILKWFMEWWEMDDR